MIIETRFDFGAFVTSNLKIVKIDSRLLKNSPFTWFDELTTGFDLPVLSPSFVRINSAEGSKHENLFSAAC